MPVGSFALGGIYAEKQAQAEKLYQDTLTGIATRKQSILSQYGYNPDYSVDPLNKYGSYQQLEHSFDVQKAGLNTERDRFTRDYGVERQGDSGYSVNPAGDGVLQRMSADHSDLLKQIADARTKTQYDAGLKADFDPTTFDPTKVGLSTENQHGSYQNLLMNEADQLDAAEGDSANRGLGRSGVGARAGDKLSFRQEGDRQGMMEALTTALKSGAQTQRDENTQYTRRDTDVNRSISDALKDFFTNDQEIDYGRGAAETALARALSGDLSGLGDESLAAQNTRNDSTIQNRIDAAREAIANQDYTPAAQARPRPSPKPAAKAAQLKNKGTSLGGLYTGRI